MAATETVASFGRIAVFGDLSGILVTINANGAIYATGTGVPIDLTAALTQAAPFSQPYLNPADIVGICCDANPSSPGKYYPANLVVGTPTYTSPAPYPFAGGSSSSLRPSQALATCPATVQLFTIAGAEFAAGACNETFTFMLLVARGGTNVN